MRLNEYLNMLIKIYGKDIVENFTIRFDKDQKLGLLDDNGQFTVINNFIKNYTRTEGEGCQFCKAIFRNSFIERIMDFPSWHPKNPLNFKGNNCAKEIMLIGEAPSPKIQRNINIAYELGRYSINPDGSINLISEKDKGIKSQIKFNNLWKYLKKIFNNNLPYLKTNIYITDICKCNDDIKVKNEKTWKLELEKNMEIWDNCSKRFILKEIQLISPKLIIFQGETSFNYIISLLIEEKIIRSKKEICKDISEYYTDFKLPKFGKFTLNGKDIKFFNIYHQSYINYGMNKEKIPIYYAQTQRFVRQKLAGKIINIK